MVELVIFLHKVIRIVCNDGRAVILTCLLHNSGKVGNHLYQSLFLLTQFNAGRQLSRDFDTGLFCLAENRLDTCISILDERSRITIKVDGLFWIECHVLAGIHFQDEVLQGTQTNDTGDIVRLFLCQTIQLTQFIAGFLGCINHLRHQVVSINYCTFAALHLALGKFHHTVREVHQPFTPFEAQFVEQDGQYLEMVILFVAYHINHLVDGIICKAEFGSTYILRHVDGCTVRTQQQLVVQPLPREVRPYRAIFFPVEKAFLQAFHHLLLTFEVRV